MSHAHHRTCTPSSSRPSSPVAAWDSSPPSSPSPSYLDLSAPPSQKITDPFAASYISNRPKRDSSSLSFSPHPKKARYTAPIANREKPKVDDLEYKIWEEATNHVFESGCRTIDLRCLTNHSFSCHTTPHS